ncbi:MAG: SPOR domain-containing protein [Lentimicrobium sp.]|nr:SPOR domain-containing protein [Lentimicrobium sp.]
MSIEKYISELLTEQDCVIVSGFGGFIAKYIPAGINPVTNVFTPPTRQVAFNSSLRNNDGLLANHLVQTLKISYSEASALIDRQSFHWTVALNSGAKVNIENIGLLFTDKERNLQFTPESSINFFDDAFGLSSFTSQPVEKMGSLQKASRNKVRSSAVPSGRKLPSSIKWAAVLLPLAALSFWGAFNTDKINSIYNNNSASVIPVPEYKPAKEMINPFLVTIPKSNTLAETTIAEVPVGPPVETVVAEAEKPIIKEIKAEADNFFIIAGAFAVEENANRLVKKLKEKGYNSSIAGQNHSGLYRVSIEAFSEKEKALQKTEELRKGDFPGAWLLTLR